MTSNSSSIQDKSHLCLQQLPWSQVTCCECPVRNIIIIIIIIIVIIIIIIIIIIITIITIVNSTCGVFSFSRLTPPLELSRFKARVSRYH